MDQQHSPEPPSQNNDGEAPKPEITPEPKVEQDRELNRINEARWEYDLPELTRDDIREYHRRYMDDKYGYDIDK